VGLVAITVSNGPTKEGKGYKVLFQLTIYLVFCIDPGKVLYGPYYQKVVLG